MKVYQIDDGEIHHVVAESEDHALRIHCDCFDFTLNEYKEEYEGYEITEWNEPVKINVTEDCDLRYGPGYPMGTQIFVEIPVRLFDQLQPGVLCSTCF